MGFTTPTLPSVGDKITAAQGVVIANDLIALGTRTVTQNTTAATTFSTGTHICDAPAVAGNGVSQFMISATWLGVGSTVVGDVIQLQLRQNGGTVIQAVQVATTSATGTGILGGGSFFSVNVPPTGSMVYNLVAVRLFGTGTCNIYGATTAPITLIVQQVG
jgi:hypothetical protein